MKKLVVAMSAALLAATAFAGSADARPGRGHAYGHYKHHGYRYSAPYRGYYAPRHVYRRSNGAALAAGVTGAIIGGAIAASQPHGYYQRPAYGYYGPPRGYYREDYYDYGY